MSRLWVCACALSLILACAPATPTSVPASDTGGRLVYVGLDGLWEYDLNLGTSTRLIESSHGSFASAPSVSPDGRLIAYNVSRYGTSQQDPGGTALWIMHIDASAATPVVAAVAAGDSPAWAPDGRALYVTVQKSGAPPGIARVTADGSESSVVVANATSPAISPDGSRIVFVVSEPSGEQALWVAGTDGSNPKQLVGPPDIALVDQPRFSPDGRQLAFAAVPTSSLSQAAATGVSATLAGLFGPAVAEAHGVPYDIWLVDVDGRNAHRITQLDAHVDYPNWSADGRWLSFTGEPGLYLVKSDGSNLRQVSQEGLPSGLGWIPDPQATSIS